MSIDACVHFETDVAGGFKGCIIKTVKKKKRIKNKSFVQEAALSQMSIYAQKKKKKVHLRALCVTSRQQSNHA